MAGNTERQPVVYGYARVSTRRQMKDGNSIEAQEAQLRLAGAEVIYKDAFTGKSKHRPAFDRLLKKLQPGDTLIVSRLDRFARSVVHGYELVNGLIDKGVTVNILNMGVLDNSSMSRFLRNMMFVFAEFERDLIMERTAEGKEIARATNPDYREGRLPIVLEGLEQTRAEVARGLISVKDACRIHNISRSTWYNKIKELEGGAL